MNAFLCSKLHVETKEVTDISATSFKILWTIEVIDSILLYYYINEVMRYPTSRWVKVSECCFIAIDNRWMSVIR